MIVERYGAQRRQTTEEEWQLKKMILEEDGSRTLKECEIVGK